MIALVCNYNVYVFIPGPFPTSTEEATSLRSSTSNSIQEDTANYGSLDSRLATNSPAVNQSPHNSVELGGPDEKTRLLN